MRHRMHTAKLGRNSGHRKAMLVNLACSLIEHNQIKTTLERAKELRRVVEKLITHAKKGGLHQRRLVIADLKVNTPSDRLQTKKDVVEKLFAELAPRYAQRPGGYTRIIRLGKRIGDAAERCLIQLVEDASAPVEKDEEPKKAKKAAAPKKAAKPAAKKAPKKAKAEKAEEAKA